MKAILSEGLLIPGLQHGKDSADTFSSSLMCLWSGSTGLLTQSHEYVEFCVLSQNLSQNSVCVPEIMSFQPLSGESSSAGLQALH